MSRSQLVTLAVFFVMIIACSKPERVLVESEIYLVRHFQKQEPSQQSGSDVALSNEGLVNANRLAFHLETKDINAIYSTNYKRTIQTATPISELNNISISIYNPRELQDFAVKLLTNKFNQLIVGHSNTTGVLFGLLGCEPIVLTEHDYGDIMVVKRQHSEMGATLLSCSNYELQAPSPVTANLLYVKQSKLHEYYNQKNTAFSFNSVRKTEPLNDGVVEVGFIIEENGTTSSFEIVKSSPAGSWHTQALNAAQQLSFTPTNNRVPAGKRVYTTWVFEFTAH